MSSWPHAGLYGPESFTSPDGRPAAGAAAALLDHTGGSPVPLFDGPARAHTVPNPTTLDSLGNLALWAEPGTYSLRVQIVGFDAIEFPVSIAPSPADIGAVASVPVLVPSPAGGPSWLWDLSTHPDADRVILGAPPTGGGIVVVLNPPKPSTTAQAFIVLTPVRSGSLFAVAIFKDNPESGAATIIPGATWPPADLTEPGAWLISCDGITLDTWTAEIISNPDLSGFASASDLAALTTIVAGIGAFGGTTVVGGGWSSMGLAVAGVIVAPSEMGWFDGITPGDTTSGTVIGTVPAGLLPAADRTLQIIATGDGGSATAFVTLDHTTGTLTLLADIDPTASTIDFSSAHWLVGA